MKFSPVLVLAALFASAFALPTEEALSKRLDITFGSVSFDPIITIRDVDEHLAARQLLTSVYTMASTGVTIVIKRDTEELSKRSEDYNFVITSLPPLNSLSRRSTDAYAGRPLLINIPQNMVEGLQQIGVSQPDIPSYFSNFLHLTDPATGEQYKLIPDGGSSATSDDPVVLDMIYRPL